jgi:hypothetical protein
MCSRNSKFHIAHYYSQGKTQVVLDTLPFQPSANKRLADSVQPFNYHMVCNRCAPCLFGFNQSPNQKKAVIVLPMSFQICKQLNDLGSWLDAQDHRIHLAKTPIISFVAKVC